MPKMNTTRILLLGLIVLLVFGLRNTMFPKEAVEDVDGLPCTEDTDCPCFGKYNVSGVQEEAWGIGISSCHTCEADEVSGTGNLTACLGQSVGAQVCDTTWCYDIEPWGDWVRQNPWEWVKDPENAMIVMAVVGLIALIIFWPA